MLTSKDDFLKILSKSNDFLTTTISNNTHNFSKEIIESVTIDTKNKISILIEQIKSEISDFSVNSIRKSRGFIASLFNYDISSNDIHRFVLKKKNNIINLKTDLILLEKNILKTELFLNEELKSIKTQLEENTLLISNTIKEADILKNTVLDLNDLDEIMIAELNNNKNNCLIAFEEQLQMLKTKNLILKQHIEFLILQISSSNDIRKKINNLINHVLDKWNDYYTNQILNRTVDIAIIHEVNSKVNSEPDLKLLNM